MKNRILSLVLTLALLCTLLPAAALTAHAEVYSGTCGAEGDGSNLTWTLNTDTGVLTISGSGAMANTNNGPWYSYRSDINDVELPDGLTSIGRGAFWECAGITSMTIPDSVTEIGASAFWGCAGLTSVTIPDCVTEIGDSAFRSCAGLTSVIIPDGVANIDDHTFMDCRSLTSVTIPNSVTKIGQAAFYECTSLTSMTIPDCVTSIGKLAFFDCSSLASVTIPSSVKSIGQDAFKNCTCLTNITLDTPTVGDWFQNMSSITTVSLGEHVLSIGDYAFYRCTALTNITISDSVTSVGKAAFYECTSLASLTIPDGVERIGNDAFDNCNSLTSVTIGASVLSIGDDAFRNCSSLTSVTIPDSVTSIGVFVFSGCSSLTSLIIGNNVKSINDYSFSGCSSLTSVTIPDSVLRIYSYSFSGCSSLSSVTIGNGVKDIRVRAFYECTALTSITIPDSVTSIGNCAFESCTALPCVTIPASVISIGKWAFGFRYDSETNTDELIEDFVIYGYNSTAAQAYADENSITFIQLDEPDPCESGHTPGAAVEENRTEPTCTETGGFDLAVYCTVCGTELSREHVEIAATGHTPEESVEENRVEPSCTEAGGYDTVVYCTLCGAELDSEHVEIAALGHDWGEASYEWAEDLSSVTASHSCKRCELTEAETATTTSKVTLAPTAETEGEMTYTAVFENPAFEKQAKIEPIPKLDPTDPCANGHDWGEWTQTLAPTCTEVGMEIRSCTRCDATESRAIPALGHDWGEPEYVWADDYSTVTASRVCRNDASHIETEAVNTTSEVTKEATYDEEGEIVYTAVFENEAFETQTKVVVVPKLEKPSVEFTDVPAGAYYADAVAWAVANGVTNGTSPTSFSPNSECTRGQVVTFLWRAKGSPEPNSVILSEAKNLREAKNLQEDTSAQAPQNDTAQNDMRGANPFTDVSETAYYYKAVLWAVENGITNGTSATTFGPNNGCTRGQVVTFLWRTEGQPEPTSEENPFEDVTGGFYYKAVLWAVENKITAGIDATHFKPDNTCTRGQIVTFLYRDLG